MKATSANWKIEPFGAGIPIPFTLEIPHDEMEAIFNGLIPEEMEDKWFIYFEQPFLYLHRSWTGKAVYRLEFDKSGHEHYVKEAQIASDLVNAENKNLDYQGKLAHFLVCNLLLKKNLPFPKPDMNEPIPGVYQHHISGTGYPEYTTPIKKKWWRIWKRGKP